MKLPRSAAALVILGSITGVASAQNVITTSSGTGWQGFYGGVNLGGIWNSTCNTWDAQTNNAAINNALNNRDCPNGGVFAGGVQLGYNFQYQQIVWGLGVDWDHASSKDRFVTRTYTGPSPPPTGTYSAGGKVEPDSIFLLGPRIGYLFEGYGDWLPYIRAGGAFTSGSATAALNYTPDAAAAAAGATSHTFIGSKNTKNNGWMIGAGVEWEFMDQWSAGLEYNYINLGKSSSSVESCTGSAAACAAFGNFTIENTHNSFTASMVRLKVNYRFWSP
jgi:outer membrane immunogenic protein